MLLKKNVGKRLISVFGDALLQKKMNQRERPEKHFLFHSCLVSVHLDPSIAFDFDGFVEFLMGGNKTSLIFFFFPIRSRETKLSRDATFLFLLALFTERKRSFNKSPIIKSPNKDTIIEIKFLEGVL